MPGAADRGVRRVRDREDGFVSVESVNPQDNPDCPLGNATQFVRRISVFGRGPTCPNEKLFAPGAVVTAMGRRYVVCSVEADRMVATYGVSDIGPEVGA